MSEAGLTRILHQTLCLRDTGIPVNKEDIPKTAFVTPYGHYEFIKIPFEMVSLGATLSERGEKTPGRCSRSGQLYRWYPGTQ